MIAVDRAKRLMTSPGAEWRTIDREFTDAGRILRGYVAPLALIPGAAVLVGAVVFGRRAALFGGYQLTIADALVEAAVGFVATLVYVYALGALLGAIAPGFGGQANRVQGVKVAAYAATPVMLGGVFNLVPGIGPFGLLAALLFSLYLLWTGAPIVMRVRFDQAGGFSLVATVIGLVLTLVTTALATIFT